jgi:acid phosphatase family membrane protein YuiD
MQLSHMLLTAKGELVNYYPYLLIPAASWAIAQLIKFSWTAFRGRIDFRQLYASGGMPSAHSAVVTSLATTIFFLEGAHSAVFGIAVMYGGIVMYDSLGVRRASGEQAAKINSLLDDLARHKINVDEPGRRLREVLGHQPLEVAAGALLGVVLATLFNFDKISGLTNYLSGTSARSGVIAIAAVSVVLLIGGVGFKLWTRFARRRSAAWRNLSRDTLIYTQLFGWLGLLAAFLAYEHAAYLSWRLWSLVILIAAIVWLVLRLLRARRELPPMLAHEAERERLGKWLDQAKRKKPKRKKA